MSSLLVLMLHIGSGHWRLARLHAWAREPTRSLLQVLDVGVTVNPNYTELKEVALFLLQPGSSVPEGAGLGLYISVGGAEWCADPIALNSTASSVRHERRLASAGSIEGRSAPSTHQRSCRCSGLSPSHLRSLDLGWFSWASQWSPRVRCRPVWDQLELLTLAGLTCEGSSGLPVLAGHH